MKVTYESSVSGWNGAEEEKVLRPVLAFLVISVSADKLILRVLGYIGNKVPHVPFFLTLNKSELLLKEF